jgi:hypothetical protein
MWDSRLFFLEPPVEIDSAYEAPTGLMRLRQAGHAELFARELRADNFTHVLIEFDPANGYLKNELPFSLLHDRLYPAAQLERDRDLLWQFVEGQLERIYEEGSTGVFRIR